MQKTLIAWQLLQIVLALVFLAGISRFILKQFKKDK